MVSLCIGLLAFGACNSQPPGTSTPIPTHSFIVAIPTVATVPPTPSTVMPITTLVAIPSITPRTPRASVSPRARKNKTDMPPRGDDIFVTGVRIDPPTPHNKESVSFFATFNNMSGRDIETRWCAEVFRPGEGKSFGISKCASDMIPRGTSEQDTFGWNIAGIHDCIPLRARIVRREDGDARIPFKQPNGQDLWLNFQACP